MVIEHSNYNKSWTIETMSKLYRKKKKEEEKEKKEGKVEDEKKA